MQARAPVPSYGTRAPGIHPVSGGRVEDGTSQIFPGLMPTPVSATSIRSAASRCLSALTTIVTPPCSVNLTALLTRLSRISRPAAGRLSAVSAAMRYAGRAQVPWLALLGIINSTIFRTDAMMSNALKSTSSSPASILDMSSTSLISSSRCLERTNHTELLALLVVDRPRQTLSQDSRKADDGIQRRPQLVGHGCQKCRLRPIRRSARMRALRRSSVQVQQPSVRDPGSSRSARAASCRSVTSIESRNTPSGTGCTRRSNHLSAPSGNTNLTSCDSATRSSMHRRMGTNADVRSIPGQTSCIVRPRNSALGR